MKLVKGLNEVVESSEKKGNLIPLDIQFFAGGTDGNDDKDDDSNEDQDDDKEEDQDDDDDKDNKEGKNTKQNKEKTFTQSQVNRMMAKEKKQGRNSVLSELGIKDEKQAKTLLSQFKAFIDSQKTDEEKNAENVKALEDAANKSKKEAEIANAKVEALKLGAKPDFVDDIITLAINKVGEDGDVKTVIAEMKEKYKNMFGDEEDDKDNKGSKGTGSSLGSNKGSKGKGGEKSLGARLAKQRGAGKSKKSAWNN